MGGCRFEKDDTYFIKLIFYKNNEEITIFNSSKWFYKIKWNVK